jgi:predicted nucleic acid-binding protein
MSNIPWNRVLLDTNVWFDYFLGFRPGHCDSYELACALAGAGVDLLCSVTSTKDLFYLIAADFKRDYRCRHDGQLTAEGAAAADETAWACLACLDEIATVVGCDQSDVWLARAQRSLHNDYEDNLILAAAQRAKVDCLITNDQSLIDHSPVAALSPRRALDYVAAASSGCPAIQSRSMLTRASSSLPATVPSRRL